MNYRQILILLITLPLFVSVALANKKDAEAKALIEHAKQLSDIRSEGAPSFRLKFTFKILGDDGSATEGDYTEVWISKAQWRKETAFGDFHKTEVAMGRKNWVLDNTETRPDDIASISGIAQIEYLEPDRWKPQKVEDHEVKGINMRCAETGTAALCFDKLNGTLTSQTTSVQRGTRYEKRVCLYSGYQKFGEHLLAKSYLCYEHAKPRLEAQLVELTPNPALDPAMFTPMEGAKESVNCLGTVRPPKLVNSVTPPLPKMSRSGDTILMTVVVDTTGKPKDPKVVSTPDQSFDQVALNAIRQWRFKPALCDGEPMEKTMAVEINFRTY